MAKFTKLTKEQSARKEELAQNLQRVYDQLAGRIEDFNEAQRNAFEDVTRALDDYNAVIQECNEFKQEIIDQQNEYYENQSGKWQDSSKGNNYADWQNAWQEDLDEVQVNDPEELEVPYDAVESNVIEDLPDEVDNSNE